MRESRTQDGDGSSCFLWDAERLAAIGPEHFDPAWWQQRERVQRTAAGGRGNALFVTAEHDETWVLRHYQRGGLIAKFIDDTYLYLGRDNNRAFREWRLLALMCELGLPVPTPVAAQVQRTGMYYRADLITLAVPDTVTLAERLQTEHLAATRWQTLGALLAQFHAAGIDHHDLNAHNILIDNAGQFTLIDFDKGRQHPPGRWREANLARLRRSLDKLSAASTGYHFAESDWQALLGGNFRRG